MGGALCTGRHQKRKHEEKSKARSEAKNKVYLYSKNDTSRCLKQYIQPLEQSAQQHLVQFAQHPLAQSARLPLIRFVQQNNVILTTPILQSVNSSTHLEIGILQQKNWWTGLRCEQDNYLFGSVVREIIQLKTHNNASFAVVT